MSRIYFHSPSEDTEVRGSERAYGAYLINEMFVTALGVNDYDYDSHPHTLRAIIAPDHYCLRESGKRFADTLRTALHVHSFGPTLVIDKQPVDTFAASLNTGILLGSDPLIAYARLHGQCEIHAYIEGRNRAWFAKILQRGLDTKLMRPDCGWEQTVEMLHKRKDEPVVTSYSVCDQFPNAEAAGWKPTRIEDGEACWDDWYDISESEQWELGMKSLRAEPNRGLEIRPRGWNNFYFGEGWNGFTLAAKAVELSQTKAA